MVKIMSWIRGEVIMENDKKKDLNEAYYEIEYEVQSNQSYPDMHANFKIKKISNKVFESYEEAYNYLREVSQEWSRSYNPYVEFIDVEKAKVTSKMKTLEKRINDTYGKKMAYIEKEHMVNHKSSLIGCCKCGSKIARLYIGKNDKCPVCGNDLRSDTVKNTIKRYEEIMNDCKKQLSEEKKKQKNKCPHKFLVMYEEYIG